MQEKNGCELDLNQRPHRDPPARSFTELSRPESEPHLEKNDLIKE